MLPSKSIRDNFLGEGMPMTKIARCFGSNGEMVIKALLAVMITDQVAFFNVGKTMTDGQVVQTVELVAETFNYFKPEDFKLCFKKARLGEYGQVYDRMDGPTILEWLKKYDANRDIEIEQIRISENNKLKKESAERVDFMSELATRYLAENPVKKQAVKTPIQAMLDPIQQLHNRWMKQFQDLKQRQSGYGWSVPAGMVLKYGWMPNPFKEGEMIHRRLNISEYLLYKQGQYRAALTRRK